MTDAEKKWKHFDSEISDQFRFTEKFDKVDDLCNHSREAFKESLRLAIEKEITYHEDTGPMAQESRSTEIGELKRFLLLLDSVTPKE